jgi:hypothetical protein
VKRAIDREREREREREEEEDLKLLLQSVIRRYGERGRECGGEVIAQEARAAAGQTGDDGRAMPYGEHKGENYIEIIREGARDREH